MWLISCAEKKKCLSIWYNLYNVSVKILCTERQNMIHFDKEKSYLERGWKGVISALILMICMSAFYFAVLKFIPVPIDRSLYTGITYDAPAIIISAEQIEQEKRLIAQEINFYLPVEEAAQTGDQVVFDVYNQEDPTQAVTDQEVVLGTSDLPLLLESNLIGLAAGESATIENVDQETGAVTTYLVTMKEVRSLGELDDSAIQSLQIPNVTNMQELEQYIKTVLVQEQINTIKNDAQHTIYEQATQNIPIPEPDQSLIDIYYNTLVLQLTQLAGQYSNEDDSTLTLEGLLQPSMEAENFTGTSDEYLRVRAKTNASQFLAYQAIAKQENITITDDELYDAMAADWQNYKEQYPNFIDFINATDKSQYQRNVLILKVQNFILDNAIITIDGQPIDTYTN